MPHIITQRIVLMLEKLQPLLEFVSNQMLKLRTQRPTKVSIHYRGKLKKLLDELEHHNTIRQVGSFSSDNPFIVFIVLPFVVH